VIAIALTLASPRFGIAAGDGGDARDLVQFRQEIDSLKGSEAAERRRVEQDEKHIQELEQQLKRLETQNQKIGKAASTLEINETKFRGDTIQWRQHAQGQRHRRDR
jgi:septal ring factor EnvC (AmiA/AmiB activator)